MDPADPDSDPQHSCWRMLGLKPELDCRVFALALKAAKRKGYNLGRTVDESCEPRPVIDSATAAAAAPDDDTTTVGTLGHLPVHHLQGGKKDYCFPHNLTISWGSQFQCFGSASRFNQVTGSGSRIIWRENLAGNLLPDLRSLISFGFVEPWIRIKAQAPAPAPTWTFLRPLDFFYITDSFIGYVETYVPS